MKPDGRRTGAATLRAAVDRWRRRPAALDGPLEAIILSELGRIRQKIEGLEQIVLVRLYLFLEARFDEAELRALCFNLGVDFESLGGTGRPDRIRALIAHLSRRGRLGDLMAEVQRQRPAGRL